LCAHAVSFCIPSVFSDISSTEGIGTGGEKTSARILLQLAGTLDILTEPPNWGMM
jgi:hypothetical protein